MIDNETIEYASIGVSSYASKSQRLIQLINELRTIGYGLLCYLYAFLHPMSTNPSTESIFPLPQIAVIGNQSAGKVSSVPGKQSLCTTWLKCVTYPARARSSRLLVG